MSPSPGHPLSASATLLASVFLSIRFSEQRILRSPHSSIRATCWPLAPLTNGSPPADDSP